MCTNMDHRMLAENRATTLRPREQAFITFSLFLGDRRHVKLSDKKYKIYYVFCYI